MSQNVTVEFSAIVAKCGVQPIYNNFNMCKDGFTLYPFTTCYLKGGVVRFSNKLFEYRNNEWQEPFATQAAQAMHMNLDFNFLPITPDC